MMAVVRGRAGLGARWYRRGVVDSDLQRRTGARVCVAAERHSTICEPAEGRRKPQVQALTRWALAEYQRG
jgi:hypothetical protein